MDTVQKREPTIRVNNLTKEERILLKHAIVLLASEDVRSFIATFNQGLGLTKNGQQILNSQFFSMQKITTLRGAVQKLKDAGY